MSCVQGLQEHEPVTAAGKIQEGLYKVRMLDHFAEEAGHDIEVMQGEVEGMAAAMLSGLRLEECSVDLEEMTKARQEYPGGEAVPRRNPRPRRLHHRRIVLYIAMDPWYDASGPSPKSTLPWILGKMLAHCTVHLPHINRVAATVR